MICHLNVLSLLCTDRGVHLIFETALAAVAGAVVGAFLNHRLPRAIPMVLVHSIELSTALVDPNEIVEKQALFRSMNEFPYDIGVGRHRGRMKMGQWLEYLSAYQVGLEDLLADVDDVENIAGRARQLVAVEDFVAARPEFTRQHFWWHLLEGSYRRTQEEVFSADARGRLDQIKPLNNLVDTDDEGDYLVTIENGKTILFDWNNVQPAARKNAARTLARRCAVALATNDKSALLEMLDYIRREVPQLKNVSRELVKSVETALREYQHIVVTGLLMNAGRLEYLLDSQARLVVKMKGYPRRQLRRGGFRDEPLAEDLAIDMVVESASEEKETLDEMMKTISDVALATRRRRVQARQQPRKVTAIGSGNPTIVRFISEDRLNDMEFSEELIRTYGGGERQAYLVLSIIKPRQTEPRAWYSKSVPFRNVIHQAVLPMKNS